MTPAERAALREFLAAEPGRASVWSLIIVCQAALPKLLDDCDRLERERDEARAMAERLLSSINSGTIDWDAEDARAKKKVGG